MTIRVLIVDDDTLVRAGLRLMIETQDDLLEQTFGKNADELWAEYQEQAF